MASAFGLQVRLILLFRQMMSEVNGILPADSQIPELGPSWLRGRTIRLHRQFFPASRLRKKVYILWTLMMATFIFALACVISFV